MKTEEKKQKAAAYQKKYREANKEKQQEAFRKWRAENLDYEKQWRENNRDKVNGYAKKSNEVNKDVIKERRKAGYEKNGDKIREAAIQWARDNPEQKMLTAAKGSAARSNIPFDLELKDIVIPAVCPVFGIPLFFTEGKRDNNTPSLDKIIPALGYVKGNVRVISWKANKLKSNGTAEEHQLIADYILINTPKEENLYE